MANPFASTALIAVIRRKGFIPANSALSTADFLGYANDEITYVTSVLKSVREEFLVNEVDYDVAFTSGTSQVRVPTRCVGSALRSVQLLDAQGNPQPLTRIEPERQHLYPSTGTPRGFYLRGNTIHLLPTAGGAGTLRIGYVQRVPTIVDESACGLITAINTTTKAVTLSSVPATFVSGTTLLDLNQGTAPFSTLSIDHTATIAGSILTFAALPTDLAVGDYVCLANQSPIPGLPQEAHGLLAQRVAYKIAEATNSTRLDALKASLDEEKNRLITLLTPRVTGAIRTVINPNGPGMRGNYARWRRIP